MTYTNRRIVLVGNGPVTDLTASAFIDGHDLVVRFNNFAVGGPRGTRTTHFASTFHKDVTARPGDPAVAGLTVTFVGGRRAGPVYDAWRTHIDEDWTHAYEDLARDLGSGPSAGLVALAWMIRQAPAEISLIGFSFCQDIATNGNHAPGDVGAKVQLFHNWPGEVRAFRHLARTSPVPIHVGEDRVALADELVRPTAPLAVIIPTCDRPALLANRSLPSVAAQSRRPDVVIVVDDSPWRTRRVNREIVASWQPRGTRVTYLENWRSPGAAGSWNTGLHHLHRTLPGCWVGLLDDDDAWLPDYLARCVGVGTLDGSDIVVAGLLRRTGAGPDHPHSVPVDGITAADFLAGNPHWQGSNTFARLDALLAAGGFDESFESTNDRDLGLRLLDLPWLRWSFVREHLVAHYAEPGTDRLSVRGSPRKRAGLQAFFAKYRGRMPEPVRAAFIDRADHLFGVDEAALRPDATPPSLPLAGPRGRVPSLVLGTISSPEIEVTLGFLSAVAGLAARSPGTTIELVVLDNGGPDEGVRGRLLEGLARLEAEASITCHRLAGAAERLSIAAARTRLQRGCYQALRGRRIPVWLLDDDVRFDIPTDRGEHIDWGHVPDHLGWIADLRDTGADVVIGSVTGEPPLPFASTVRVQVVDLLHNLEWMSGLAPSVERLGSMSWSHPGADAPFPSRHAENMALRRRFRDYYYDLSRVDTGQLERPFWFEPRRPASTVGDAFREMVGALDGVFAGRQVFRPLVWSPTDPSQNLLPGFNRGPNTLVFRPECLIELPTAAPRLAGQDTRRSDMNWSLLGHFVEGWRVVTAPFPVRQDRSALDARRPTDHRNLVLDVCGYAVFSALSDLLLERRAAQQARGVTRRGADVLDLSGDELATALRRTEKYMNERLVAWETSHRRVAALSRALESYLFIHRDKSRQRWHFWLDDPSFAPEVGRLSAFVRRLRREFEGRPDEVSGAVLDFDRADLARFFTHLRDDLERFRASTITESAAP